MTTPVDSANDVPEIHRGPCIAELSGPGYSPSKIYGPFVSLQACIEWITEQRKNGLRASLSISPLRTPHLERDYDDWWMSDQHRSPDRLEADFPKEAWFEPKPLA